MIFKDLFDVLPTNVKILVVGLEKKSVGGKTTQRCYTCGKLAEIAYDTMTVNVGVYKLRDAKVMRVEPVSENCLEITVLDD